MTDDEINREMAEVDEPGLYVIVKRGLYYRPEAKGYAGSISDAWKLPLAEAKKHEMYADRTDIPGCEKVLIEPVPPINYLCQSTGLSHIRRVKKKLTEEQRRKYLDILCDETTNPARIYPWNWCDLDHDDWFAMTNATPEQECTAILKAVNRWRE